MIDRSKIESPMPEVSAILSPDNLGSNLVVKHNYLVQACYKLNLQEQRLVLASLSKLDSRKSPLHPRNSQTSVRITAKEFAETFPIDPKKSYEELRSATNELFERRITEVNGKKVEKLRWVSKVAYHDGEGWAELTFSPDILPLLTLLQNKFTKYNLQRVAGLRSQYSIRIFEMCAQFAGTGMLRIEIADLIKRLDLPYTRYNDIVRRVIDPAVAELKAKSNLDISWKPIKEGRINKTIEFVFSEAAQAALPLA